MKRKIETKPFTLIKKYEDKFEYQKEPNNEFKYDSNIIYRNAFKFDYAKYNFDCGHYALFTSHTWTHLSQNHLFSDDLDVNGWTEVSIDDFETDEKYRELIRVARQVSNRIYIEQV